MKRQTQEHKPISGDLQLFKDQLTLQSANEFINKLSQQLNETNTISREDGNKLDLAYEYVKEMHNLNPNLSYDT